MSRLAIELRRAALAAAVVLLAACASAPVLRYHTLLPAQAPAPAAAEAAIAIALAPVAVPVAVDMPQWLVRLPDDTLLLLDDDLWASPLHDELRAALAEALARRWGAVAVTGRAAAWRVAVTVTRFESVPGQQAWLAGHWTLTPLHGAAAGGSPLRCAFELHETVARGTPALAEGHRRALMRLAELIGRQLQAAAAGAVPSCSGA